MRGLYLVVSPLMRRPPDRLLTALMEGLDAGRYPELIISSDGAR